MTGANANGALLPEIHDRLDNMSDFSSGRKGHWPARRYGDIYTAAAACSLPAASPKLGKSRWRHDLWLNLSLISHFRFAEDRAELPRPIDGDDKTVTAQFFEAQIEHT